jgi:hypothetical protein
MGTKRLTVLRVHNRRHCTHQDKRVSRNTKDDGYADIVNVFRRSGHNLVEFGVAKSEAT